MTMKDLVLAAQIGGIDLTAELLSCGCIDLLVDCLDAVKQAGAENCNGMTMWSAHRHSAVAYDASVLTYCW